MHLSLYSALWNTLLSTKTLLNRSGGQWHYNVVCFLGHLCTSQTVGGRGRRKWALKLRQCGRDLFQNWDKNKNVSFQCLSLRNCRGLHAILNSAVNISSSFAKDVKLPQRLLSLGSVHHLLHVNCHVRSRTCSLQTDPLYPRQARTRCVKYIQEGIWTIDHRECHWHPMGVCISPRWITRSFQSRDDKGK